MSAIEFSKRLLKKGPINAAESVLSVVEDFWFEVQHQLDTRSEVAISDLDISDADKAHADKYKPTRKRYFRKLMAHLSLPSGGVFVDVGCGKGRVLLLASKYGFDEVVGLEISPMLTEIARKNSDLYLTQCKNCSPIRVECTNILDYNMKGSETIFFLYSPFDYEVTHQFLNSMRQSIEQCPRKIWLVIDEFRFPDLLENDPHLKLQSIYEYGAATFHVYSNDHRNIG